MNGMMAPVTMVDADGCVQHTVPKASLQIPATNVIDSAHYGYVYCMTLLPPVQKRSNGTTQLVTGSGDETIKVTSHCNDNIASSDITLALGLHAIRCILKAYV